MPKASFGKHWKTVALNRLAVISVGQLKLVVRKFEYFKTVETTFDFEFSAGYV